ncbi:hypothetical protein ACOSP7_000442 [Xanthoceras sorbifolium]
MAHFRNKKGFVKHAVKKKQQPSQLEMDLRKLMLPYIVLKLKQIVLSGFGTTDQHLKLTAIMFHNIFPAIDINIVQLSTCQKIVKFVQNHQVPDLRSLQDVSDFVTRVGYGSDSEGDDEAATVTLTSKPGGDPGRGAPPCLMLLSFRRLDQKMTLQLVKVEDGLCSHSVIFNEYVYMLTVILLSFLLCPFLNFDELRKTSASSRPIDDKKKDDKEPKNQQDDEESEEDIEDEED